MARSTLSTATGAAIGWQGTRISKTPQKMFQTYGVCGDMQRCGLWWICGFALKMVRGFFWTPAWRCLGLGLRGEQVQVTGAGPQHQGAPHTTVHHTPPCSSMLHQRSSSGAPPPVPGLVRAPALGSCQEHQAPPAGQNP